MNLNIEENTIIIKNNIIYYKKNENYVVFKGNIEFLKDFYLKLYQKEKFLQIENIPFKKQIDHWVEIISNIFKTVNLKRYSLDEEINFYREYCKKLLFICKFYKKHKKYFKENTENQIYYKHLIKNYFKLNKDLNFFNSILDLLQMLKNSNENFYAKLFQNQHKFPPVLHKNLILICRKSNLSFSDIFHIEKIYFLKKHMVLRNNYNMNLLCTDETDINIIFTDEHPAYFVRRYYFLTDQENYRFYVILLYKYHLDKFNKDNKEISVNLVQKIVNMLPERMCMRFVSYEYDLLNRFIKIAFKSFKNKPTIDFKKIRYTESVFENNNRKIEINKYLNYSSLSISLARSLFYLLESAYFVGFLKFYKRHEKPLRIYDHVKIIGLLKPAKHLSLSPYYDDFKKIYSYYKKFAIDTKAYLNYEDYSCYFKTRYRIFRNNNRFIEKLTLCVNRDCRNNKIGFKFEENRYIIPYHYDITLIEPARNLIEIKDYHTKKTKKAISSLNRKIRKFKSYNVEKRISKNILTFKRTTRFLTGCINRRMYNFLDNTQYPWFFVKYLSFSSYTLLKYRFDNIDYSIDPIEYKRYVKSTLDQLPILSYNFTKEEYEGILKKFKYFFIGNLILSKTFKQSTVQINQNGSLIKWYNFLLNEFGRLPIKDKQLIKVNNSYLSDRNLNSPIRNKLMDLMNYVRILEELRCYKYSNYRVEELIFLNIYDLEREIAEIKKSREVQKIRGDYDNFKVNLENILTSVESLKFILLLARRHALDITDNIANKIILLEQFNTLQLKYKQYENDDMPILHEKYNTLVSEITTNWLSVQYNEKQFDEIYSLFKEVDNKYTNEIEVIRRDNPVLCIVSRTVILQYIRKAITIYDIFVHIYGFDNVQMTDSQVKFKKNEEVILLSLKNITIGKIQQAIEHKVYMDYKYKIERHQYFISAFHFHLNNFLHNGKIGNQMTEYLSRADMTYYAKPSIYSSIAYSNRTDLIYTDYTHNIISTIFLYEKYKKGVIIYGKSGTGKTETVKYFAQITNKKIINFCCTSHMTYEILIDIIEGVAQYGAYILLDEFNRLPLHVICKFYTYLTTHDIFCFITINNMYRDRTELPITFTNLFGMIDGNSSNIYDLIPHLFEQPDMVIKVFKYLQSTNLFNPVYFDIRTIKMISMAERCKLTAIYNFYSSMLPSKYKEVVKKEIKKITNRNLIFNSLSNEIYYALNNYRGILVVSENENILRELRRDNNVFYEENDKFIEELQTGKNKHIIFDRELQSHWIENFNSVFDDNMNYRTRLGDKVDIRKNLKFIFIGKSTKDLSPATLSRLPLIVDENKKRAIRTVKTISCENDLELIKEKLNTENIISVNIPDHLLYILSGRLDDIDYLSKCNLQFSMDQLRYMNKYGKRKYILLNIENTLFTHYDIKITQQYDIKPCSFVIGENKNYLLTDMMKNNYAKLIYFTSQNFNLILRGKGWNFILRNSGNLSKYKKLNEHEKYTHLIRKGDILLLKSLDLPVTVIENTYSEKNIVEYCGYATSIEKAYMLYKLKDVITDKLSRTREYLKHSIELIDQFNKKNTEGRDGLNKEIRKLNEYIERENENISIISQKKITLNEKLILYRENKKILDENLSKASELNENLKKKLLLAEDNLRISQENIEKIDKNSLFELKNMNSPPAIVRSVLSIIYYIFTDEQSDNWNRIRKFIKGPDFIKNIKEKMNFAEEQLIFINEFLVDDSFSYSKIERASKPASILYIWIKSIYDNTVIKKESKPLEEKNMENKKTLEALKNKIAEEEIVLNDITSEIKNINRSNMKIGNLITEKRKEIAEHKANLEQTEKILRIFYAEKNNWVEKLQEYKNFNEESLIREIVSGNIKYLLKYNLPISIEYMGNLTYEYLSKVLDSDAYIIADRKNFIMQFNFAVEHNQYIVIDEALLSNNAHIKDHSKIILLSRTEEYNHLYFSHEIENKNFIGNRVLKSETDNQIIRYENDLLRMINESQINFNQVFSHITALNGARAILMKNKEDNRNNREKVIFINKIYNIFTRLVDISIRLNGFALSEYVLSLFLEKNNFYNFADENLNSWTEKIINFFSFSFKKTDWKILEKEFSVKISEENFIVDYCNYVILYETNLDMLTRNIDFNKILTWGSDEEYDVGENRKILIYNSDLIDSTFDMNMSNQYFFAMKCGNRVSFQDVHIIYEEGTRNMPTSECPYTNAIKTIYTHCKEVKYDFTDEDERIVKEEKNMTAFKLLFYNKLSENDKVIFTSKFGKI